MPAQPGLFLVQKWRCARHPGPLPRSEGGDVAMSRLNCHYSALLWTQQRLSPCDERPTSEAAIHSTPSCSGLTRASTIPSQGLPQLRIQIAPVRVQGLDQLDLPSTVPALEGLFPLDCGADALVLLIPDKPFQAVGRCEAFCKRFAMLIDPTLQIGPDADIERTMLVVGRDVDKSRYAGNVASPWMLGSSPSMTPY